MSLAPAPAKATREQILSLRGIHKRFGAVRALQDVDFDVYAGEVVAIVGDNGAGKSTLVKILAGVHPQDSGTITYYGSPVTISTPTDSRDLGIATVYQDLALVDNLDVVGNLWLGRELRRFGELDDVEMEQRSWALLRELSARIPSVRIPVAALSGGQRQTVAIARSLIGEPSVVILDEPTAALGVAQTAEVLNLIERLRERRLGVILISHNIADVQAVADRIVVLRLGRNNGDFRGADITSEAIIAAITGATDNSVSRRAAAQLGAADGDGDVVAMIDQQEERIPPAGGVRGWFAELVSRVRAGDLGSIPVLVGLAVIWATFQLLNPTFLSSTNLVNLTMQCAAVGTMAIGIVLVLLIGEIDLSVGSVSGLASAILAVAFVQNGLPLVLAILMAIAAGAVAGLIFGLLRTAFGVPSFVITLAGLLGFLGVQLYVLGPRGSINIPFESVIVQFAQQWFLPDWASYAVVGIAVVVYAGQNLALASRRAAAGLTSLSRPTILVRSAVMLALLGVSAWYLNLSRGVGAMFLLFLLLVVAADYFLTRTGWGRAVHAIGGNVEAARRAGIRVNRIYISVFVICSTLAAVGGVLAAARLGAANQSSGGTDTSLNAIAAAVIGGTSLFGGRGSAFSAVLGILVIMSITSGLALLNLDSSIRYMITGVVLVLAVVIDALSRRSRAAAGRA